MKILLIIISILFAISLAFDVLCIIYIFATKNTLENWTKHKCLFWVGSIKKIKVIYCTGNGFIEVYKNENFGCLTTCIDDDEYEKYKHIFNAEIKYLKEVDEDGYLVIQLWNTRKLNKIYGVKE
mgnify:CR=1 FL=1